MEKKVMLKGKFKKIGLKKQHNQLLNLICRSCFKDFSRCTLFVDQYFADLEWNLKPGGEYRLWKQSFTLKCQIYRVLAKFHLDTPERIKLQWSCISKD